MIYALLISSVLLIGLITKPSIKNNKNQRILFIFASFFLIFLLCVLRKESVGSDTHGYYLVYQDLTIPGSHNIESLDTLYFEKGFVFLMKKCGQIGLNFTGFLFIAYLIMLIPIAIFIFKYSTNPFLSVIVFICYVYFEFYLTGLRQAISISFILLGLVFFLSKLKSIVRILIFYLFVFLAFLFHSGAIICAIIPFLKLIKHPLRFLLICVVLCLLGFLFRNYVFSLIESVFHRNVIKYDSTVYFGFNSLVTLVIVILLSLNVSSNRIRMKNKEEKVSILAENDYFFLNMLSIGIFFSFLFGTDTMARVHMYFNVVIIILLPKLSSFFDNNEKPIFDCLATVFLIGYFLLNININNNFNILPYHFFWN